MSNPKVSIIMPVYNAGIFLKDALSDLINQTYKNFELICVDDGSIDKSKEVLDFFSSRDERIIIRTQPNSGAGEARNSGIRMAKGEYLLFLDADDRFEPILLEETIKKAEKTAADIVVFDAKAFDSWSGLVLEERWVRKELLGEKEVFNREDNPDSLFLFTPSCAWNKLFRANFIKKLSLQFQNYPYMNDVYFSLIALATADKITTLDEVLLMYRKGRAASISSEDHKKDNPEYAFTVLNDTRNKLIELGLFDLLWKSFANHAIGIVFSHMSACSSENYELFEKKLNPKFLSETGIRDLHEDDIIWSIYTKRVEALCNKGFTACLAQSVFDLEKQIAQLNRVVTCNGEKKDNNRYFFDIGRIPHRSKIIIYGAGFRGNRIHELNTLFNVYDQVGWVDSNAENILNADIEIPDKINTMVYDYIIIAVDDVSAVKDIRQKLINSNIDEEVIVW